MADNASELLVEAMQTQANADHIWVLVATSFVLLMQAGFMLLEAGATRSKNSIAVAQKNLVDLCLSVGVFFLIGFSIMFGTSHGWFGWSPGLATFANEDTWTLAFFAFQAVFAGTAATIMSGSVAERMQFGSYIVLAVLLAGVLYPVYGHWAWGNLLDGDNPAWLADQGFMDFAGSTVVHSAGGWFALAIIVVLGARIGRFDEKRKPKTMNGHSLVLSATGAVILLFGWFGFNAGSTVAATADVAMILANTLLAAAFGGTAATIVGRLMDGYFLPLRAINGLLGGLVGITAGCAFVDLHGAMWIGLASGVIVILSEEFLLRWCKLDDVVGAVSVHGVCGAAGTMLLAFFALPEYLAAASRWGQFMIQLKGVAIGFAWFFGTGWVVAKGLAMFGKLRVSEEDEIRGLNLAEHGVQMSTGAMQEALTRLTMVERDLTQRLPTMGGDDAAEIAQVINPFLSDMQKSLVNVKSHATDVSAASTALLSLSRDLATDTVVLSQVSNRMVSSADHLNAGAKTAMGVVGGVAEQAELLADKSSAMASDMADLTDTVRNMAVTIHDISSDATHASQVSNQALSEANASLNKISSLNEASEAVDEVLGRIREISDKTILLALNARVEAARSGAAGRGFAIVAQEVAELSRQTQGAADLITERISEMKQGSLDALAGMRAVSEVLKDLVGNMHDVSGATQSQTQAIAHLEAVAETGNKMAEDVKNGADKLRAGTQEMTKFASEVREGSEGTMEIAQELKEGSDRGKRNADQLALSSVQLARDSEHLSAASRRYKA